MTTVRESRLEVVPAACERPQATGDGSGAVVAARDLTRRYGTGGAAVDRSSWAEPGSRAPSAWAAG